MAQRAKLLTWAIAVILLCLAAVALKFRAQNPQARAERLFAAYMAYQQTSDPRLAELFDDSAMIRSTLLDGTPDGKTVTVTAPQYKELIRAPRKARGKPAHAREYFDVSFVSEGARVRISANRRSGARGLTAPLSLLVGPDNAGTWRIFEEAGSFRQ